MAKKLSPWCKEAKKKMIDMDLEVNELASSLGLTRPCRGKKRPGCNT